ncbi:MAG: hypothetical protein H0S85_04440 [Desulfovibrionaceae bacterium]|jgi:hypothetical protein|nr:hypothetical protein [Desulfovibrionaceae bacterium]
MDTVFYTLQDFLLHSKSVTYVLMGLGLLLYVFWWWFLTDKDEKKRLF